MDPNAAARTMRDESLPIPDRRYAAEGLLGWLLVGGFPQSMTNRDGSHRTFGGNTAARLAAKQECREYLAAFGDEEDDEETKTCLTCPAVLRRSEPDICERCDLHGVKR